MPEEEQKQRLQRMQSILSVQTVNKWAADFVNELNATCMKNDMLRKKRIVAAAIAQIKLKYNQAKQRLILLDYDGTLRLSNHVPRMHNLHRNSFLFYNNWLAIPPIILLSIAGGITLH